jgi:catechol 2,3-dioxygenase-like lactoylglutathione lyase family enzyme
MALSPRSLERMATFTSLPCRSVYGAGMIRCLGHAAFTVADLDASVAFATGLLGMREMERREGAVYLTAGGAQHALEYRQGPATAFDHLALQADGTQGVEQARAAVERAGVAVDVNVPLEPNVEAAIRFRAPSGHLVEVYAPAVEGLAPYHWLGQPPHLPSGVRPRRAQHVNVNCPDVRAATDFFVEVLGFRLSDQIVGPDGAAMMNFLRCNADHHTLAVGQGAAGALHVAFEVDSVLDLVRLGDLLDSVGRAFLWGPGRHAAGDNVATYFQEPSLVPIEYFAEMERIHDDRRPVRRYAMGDRRVASIWGPTGDLTALFAAAIPLAPA